MIGLVYGLAAAVGLAGVQPTAGFMVCPGGHPRCPRTSQAGPDDATGVVTIELVNSSGRAIAAVATAPSGEDSWSPQPDAPVGSGGRGTVVVETLGGQCAFDLRVSFADGSSRDLSGVDLCQAALIVVT